MDRGRGGDTRINPGFTIERRTTAWSGGGRSGACVRAARHNGGKEQSKPLISRGEVKVASRKHLREAKAAGTVG